MSFEEYKMPEAEISNEIGKDIVKKFIVACKEKDFQSQEAKIPLFIALSTVFTLVLVLPIKDIVEKMLVAPIFTGVFLIITSIVLYSSEWMSKRLEQKESNITVTLLRTRRKLKDFLNKEGFDI